MAKNSNALDRREVVALLLAKRKDAVVVAGLGNSTYDLAAAGDHDRNFYLWGAMGGAAMIALGVALAQPDVPVVVVTGDGEMLMGMGGLATIALQNPTNLHVVVLDNERYGETGGQTSHTAGVTNLAVIAEGCGIKSVRTISTMDEVERLAEVLVSSKSGPTYSTIKIDKAEVERVLPYREAAILKDRVRRSLGHESF
jgi:thiamine pyrophosphate-dependent acetolactate synthase large subunit-like protein